VINVIQLIYPFRAKMATNVRECEERNRALKEEKDAVAAHFQELKGRMNRFREGQQRRLVALTKHVDTGLRELSRKVQKAEKVLGVYEMNTKLETDEEALLAMRPQLTDAVLGDEEAQEAKIQDEDEEEPVVLNPYTTTTTTKKGKKVKEWDYTENFFRRTNKVAMDNMALENERARLEKENADLRAILKQYLDGISVNNDALRNPNPLFITNRAPTAPAPRAAVTPQQLVFQYQRT
jgi:dynein regulatory complex subunit 2